MTLTAEILETLCCPVSRAPLRAMQSEDVARFNLLVAEGALRFAVDGGRCEPLMAGLAAADGIGVYPVVDGVPHVLPTKRIVRTDASAPGGGSPPRSSVGGWGDRWAALSRRWNEIGPPERPASEDTGILEELVAGAWARSDGAGLRALMLGVTPEIATMAWPAATRLLALDFSEEMIHRVWPASARAHGVPVLADWLSMPVADGAYDVIVGDGVLAPLRYPDGYLGLFREAWRVLRPGGAFALRLFTRPDAPEPLDAVFARLRAGEFRGLDAMKWRLVAALHHDSARGVRLGDVWEAWASNVPDAPALMRSLGLPEGAPRIFEGLRGLEARFTFPTLGEVRALLASQFEERRCVFPRYEDGERYPTLLLARR